MRAMKKSRDAPAGMFVTAAFGLKPAAGISSQQLAENAAVMRAAMTDVTDIYYLPPAAFTCPTFLRMLSAAGKAVAIPSSHRITSRSMIVMLSCIEYGAAIVVHRKLTLPSEIAGEIETFARTSFWRAESSRKNRHDQLQARLFARARHEVAARR